MKDTVAVDAGCGWFDLPGSSEISHSTQKMSREVGFLSNPQGATEQPIPGTVLDWLLVLAPCALGQKLPLTLGGDMRRRSQPWQVLQSMEQGSFSVSEDPHFPESCRDAW